MKALLSADLGAGRMLLREVPRTAKIRCCESQHTACGRSCRGAERQFQEAKRHKLDRRHV